MGPNAIFISYRRTGTSGYGGRLQEDLRGHFGREQVFRDIDSIRPGSDFAEVIENAVSQASVVLALIGGNWVNARNESGDRRLDDPDDFVRLEIESAMKQDIVVVPVLVEGARMPSPGELPVSISRLGRTQAIELSDQRWSYDIGRLTKVLEEVIEPSDAQAPPPGPADTETMTVLAVDPAPSPAGPTRGRAARLVRNRRLLAGVLASVLLLVAVLVAAAGSGGTPEATAEVPNVVGHDVTAATAGLTELGLVVETRPVPSDKPGGTVVDQDPRAGGALTKGATIILFVSDNVARPSVPNLVNLPTAEAIAALEARGFVVSVVEAQSDVVAAGLVMLQSPEPDAPLDAGATVTITVSTGTVPPSTTLGPGTTIGPRPSTTLPPPTVPPVVTTRTTPLPRLATGNLVNNPGAEATGPSAPFTVGQAPGGWQRGADQAIVGAYGASGARGGCTSASYPTAGQLQGSGSRMFTGGFDGGGGCELPGGSTPTLGQGISLAPYAGRTDGVGWQASAKLASYPGSGDAAALTVEVLGGGGQVLASSTTGPVSNASDFAYQPRALGGRLPAGAASVRLTLSFPVSSSYSGGFADDVSFSLG